MSEKTYRATIIGLSNIGAARRPYLCAQTTQGALWERGLLAKAFTDQWQDNVTVEVDIPQEVTRLEKVSLYRYPAHSDGCVWYGQMRIERTDVSQEGLDVRDRLAGKHPLIRGSMVTKIIYRDDNERQQRAPLRVQLRRMQ